jgi:hypothetical protein
MNPLVRRIATFLLQLGLDPRRLLASMCFVPEYLSGALKLRRLLARADTDRFAFAWLPALSDRYMPSGMARGHYFHQDLWAARRVRERNPDRHVDVGSRIDGFVAHLLTFREVEVIDVRHLDTQVAGLHFHQADLMQPQSVEANSADSVSCLHALEHFGLGRYGDPIDAEGWRTGFCNLVRMLREGGRLYLSVPVGPQTIEYNAQRIFAPRTIIEFAASLNMRLIEFSYVDDEGNFHENRDVDDAASCRFGCGCYLFERIG